MHSHRGTELDQTGALSLLVGTLASKCPAASPATRFGLVPFMGMLFFFLRDVICVLYLHGRLSFTCPPAPVWNQ